MEALQADPLHPGWVRGWLVLRTKQALPGDFVSMHAHAAEAQEAAHLRGPGHQVFHGRRQVESGEFVID
ncbi:MAG TPA: hypothetical protein VIN03_12235 [Roseateles sp.]